MVLQKPSFILFRRVALWGVIVIASLVVTLQILSITGRGSASAFLAFVLLCSTILISSVVLIFDMRVSVSTIPYSFWCQITRKARMIATAAALGLICSLTISQYFHFRKIAAVAVDTTAPGAAVHKHHSYENIELEPRFAEALRYLWESVVAPIGNLMLHLVFPGSVSGSNSNNSSSINSGSAIESAQSVYTYTPMFEWRSSDGSGGGSWGVCALFCILLNIPCALCIGAFRVLLSVIVHYSWAISYVIASLACFSRYEKEGLRLPVITSHIETEVGMQSEALLMDGHGTDSPTHQLRMLWADVIDGRLGDRLWNRLFKASLKTSFAVTVLAACISVLSSVFQVIRCPSMTSSTSSVSMGVVDSILCDRAFNDAAEMTNSLSVGVELVRCFVVSSFIQVAIGLSYLLLRAMLLHPINFMVLADNNGSSNSNSNCTSNSTSNTAAGGQGRSIVSASGSSRSQIGLEYHYTGGEVLAASMAIGGGDLTTTALRFSSNSSSISSSKGKGNLSSSSTLSGDILSRSRSVYSSVVSSVKPSSIGPASVPYLKASSTLFGSSLGFGGLGLGLRSESMNMHNILSRTLAMQSFHAIMTCTSASAQSRRVQLYSGSNDSSSNSSTSSSSSPVWNECASNAMMYIDAFSVQVQLTVLHALDVMSYMDGTGSVGTSASFKTFMDTMVDNRPVVQAGLSAGMKGNLPRNRSSSRGRDSSITGSCSRSSQGLRDISVTNCISAEATEAQRQSWQWCQRSIVGRACGWALGAQWASQIWPLARALMGMHPVMDTVPPMVMQSTVHCVEGLGHGLLNSLSEDPTGRAQNYTTAVVECLIRLEASLELWDATIRKCNTMPGIHVLGIGRPCTGVDGEEMPVDMPSLAHATSEMINRLVRGYSDILGRGDCPLMHSKLCADALEERLHKIN